VSSIEKRLRDGRAVWRAHYRTPDGKQRNKTFGRKVDAERFLTTVESAKITGSFADPALARLTMGEWSGRWLAGQGHLKPSTRERYAGILREHIEPRWRNVRLADVRHADVQSWVSELAEQRSASTARKAHRVLSLVLALAVRDNRLARNPADGISLPREVQKDRRYLSHAEVRRLATASGAHGLVITFLAYTGLRFGESAALRVARLDLLRRRIEVAESVTAVNGKLVWGTPKGHTRRWVSVPAFVAEQLAVHVAGKSADDLVFESPQGGVLRASNFRRDVFEPAARAAGLDGLVPHALRHTAASLAIASGADVKVVQQMLGHKSATMTLDLYGHLFENRLDEVAERLDAAARADAAVAQVLPEGEIVRIETALARRRMLYSPTNSGHRVVPPAGFEPATPGLGVRRSIP
jgi:integrase